MIVSDYRGPQGFFTEKWLEPGTKLTGQRFHSIFLEASEIVRLIEELGTESAVQYFKSLHRQIKRYK